jgi:hypothetical protein
MDDVDSADVVQLIKLLHQGDIVDIPLTARLFSPDTPSFPEEVSDVPHDAPIMTMETRHGSGLSGIVSQDCDLRRSPQIEPYVLIAPLTAVADETYREAATGMSTRYFAYPVIAGHEHEQLVLDMRVVSSLEKTALLSTHVERTDCPLSAAKRDALRLWLGDRLGREAFPDDIERQVITPIEKAIKRVREKPTFEGIWASLVWVGLDWTPGKQYVSLLMLTDPARLAAQKMQKADLEAAKKRLQAALGHFTGKGDYSVVANIRGADEVSAVEILSHAELPLDLDPIDLSTSSEVGQASVAFGS